MKAKKKSKKKSSSRSKAPLKTPEIVEASPKSTTSIAPSDSLTKYLSEIRNYPLLSREDEKKLAVQYYESGDRKAAEQLITANLRFVVKIASEYTKFGAKLIDLIQEGNVGLMHAVKEFNPYKGAKIITYAVWWIRGYIQEYLMRQYSLVRIGTTQNQKKLFYQLQKEKKELERMGQQATIAQISGRMGIPEKEVEAMSQRLSERDVSLNQPMSTNDSGTFLDLQSEPDAVQADALLENYQNVQILTENIEDLKPHLSEKELYILNHRLLNDPPITLQAIGEKYNTTREAVRQMEVRLLKKIKEKLIPKI